MKKILVVSAFVCFVTGALAQSSINNYKYVIIPTQIEFLKGKDPYKLSTLSRVLFKQQGFTVFYPNEQLPQDLFDDRCLAMYAGIEDVQGGFRKTRLKIVLKDCYGKLIMTSDVGESGENVHQKRHHEALREAFKSLENLNYTYEPKERGDNDSSEIVAQKEDEEIEVVQEKEELVEEIEKAEKNINEVEQISNGDVTEKDATLHAQEKSYGYQLLDYSYPFADSEPKVVMTLLKTAAKDVFIVKGKDAIVFKSGIKWMYSQNDGASEVLKELYIKF